MWIDCGILTPHLFFAICSIGIGHDGKKWWPVILNWQDARETIRGNWEISHSHTVWRRFAVFEVRTWSCGLSRLAFACIARLGYQIFWAGGLSRSMEDFQFSTLFVKILHEVLTQHLFLPFHPLALSSRDSTTPLLATTKTTELDS